MTRGELAQCLKPYQYILRWKIPEIFTDMSPLWVSADSQGNYCEEARQTMADEAWGAWEENRIV